MQFTLNVTGGGGGVQSGAFEYPLSVKQARTGVPLAFKDTADGHKRATQWIRRVIPV